MERRGEERRGQARQSDRYSYSIDGGMMMI